MEAGRWEQVVDLYQKASECDPAARQSFLAHACNGDYELEHEVQSLLDQEVSTPGLLETVAGWASSSRAPESIGGYRILGVIGEGGMGTVYEAQQENPRRIVALKVVKPGLAIPEVLRRFEQESQVLGRLQHPGIAQVYDAGVSRGKPYFAMERICGRTLLDYAAAHHLSTTERLQLICKICDAAHHAHERGIIHRDLKSGNILVDETGQPKILDFGVARLTDADENITRRTDVGRLVGTLAYMSPEQITGDPGALDARSDVYALGLILYELLAGRPPYETGRTVPEAARIICEQEPLPLSSASREFRGDLDAIAGRALEKDKDRRYGTAADLASDIKRYLADQPVLARPASAAYRARKFVRRHKALTSTAAAVFVMLVAGILVTSWQAARARRAEQIAKAVNEFLQNDVLGQASPRAQAGPNKRPDPDYKVRTALDRAAATISGKFQGQPEVEAAIRHTIGSSYRDLGLYAQAVPHLQRALELRRSVLGAEHPDTLNTMQELAFAYLFGANVARSEALVTDLLNIQRRLYGNARPETLGAMNNVATVISVQGDWLRAARLFEEILDGDRRLLGDAHPDTLTTMHNLASNYINSGRYATAADLLTKTVESRQRVLGRDHPSTLLSMNTLAVAYRNLGRYSEAESVLMTVLAARRRSEGNEHPDTLASMNSLAVLYQAEGRYDAAAPLLTQALDIARRIRPNHPDTPRFMNNLAENYWKLGKPEAAESLFDEAIDARRRILGPTHPMTAQALATLGEMKLEQKQYAPAVAGLREALQIYEKSAPNDWRRYQAQAMLGAALAGSGNRSEAAPLLNSAYDELLRKKDSIPSEKRQIVDTVLRWKTQIQ